MLQNKECTLLCEDWSGIFFLWWVRTASKIGLLCKSCPKVFCGHCMLKEMILEEKGEAGKRGSKRDCFLMCTKIWRNGVVDRWDTGTRLLVTCHLRRPCEACLQLRIDHGSIAFSCSLPTRCNEDWTVLLCDGSVYLTPASQDRWRMYMHEHILI